jgi:hypothetical protein
LFTQRLKEDGAERHFARSSSTSLRVAQQHSSWPPILRYGVAGEGETGGMQRAVSPTTLISAGGKRQRRNVFLGEVSVRISRVLLLYCFEMRRNSLQAARLFLLRSASTQENSSARNGNNQRREKMEHRMRQAGESGETKAKEAAPRR